jgi:hypothetical protein
VRKIKSSAGQGTALAGIQVSKGDVRRRQGILTVDQQQSMQPLEHKEVNVSSTSTPFCQAATV